MAEILVINLTRMGDIVQTGPLVEGLRQKHPDARISLLVIDSFRGIAEQLSGVDEILVYGQDESVSRLMAPGWSLEQGFRWHRDFVDGLRKRSWDLVINLTHSLDSAVLSHLLGAAEVRGLCVHANGLKTIRHDWVRYFFNVTANRGFNDFNLVDIYRQIGELSPEQGTRLRLEPGEEARSRIRSLLEPGKGPLVLLQMGASKPDRRWPTGSFARTARLLREQCGARFALCGTKKDGALSREFLQAAPELPAQDLCGATSLAELSALCESADLLISNDTGTMHIAAAMDTPVVSLFMATALPEETAAYTRQAWILQPDIPCTPCSHHVECPHMACRGYITPEAVVRAAREALGVGAGEPWPDSGTIRVYRSERDSRGFQVLRSLLPKPLRRQDLVARCYHQYWQQSLGRVSEEQGDPLEEEITKVLEETLPPEDPEGLMASLAACATGFLELAELADRGEKLIDSVRKELARPAPSPETLSDLADQIGALDREILDRELEEPALRPVAVLFRFDKDGLDHEGDMDELNRGMREIYRKLGQRSRGLAHRLRTVESLLQGRLAAEVLP